MPRSSKRGKGRDARLRNRRVPRCSSPSISSKQPGPRIRPGSPPACKQRRARRPLLTPGPGLPSLKSRFGSLGDRYADHAAPLRPGAVVVAHVGVAKQLTQHEPGVARALADAAISDHVLVWSNALAAVNLSELLRTLEGAVLVGRGRPGNALGAQHVASALRAFLRVTRHVQHL